MKTNQQINTETSFIESFNALSKDALKTATELGWWAERDALVRVATTHNPELGKFAKLAIAGMSIALKHSELSEALEGIRHGNPPDDKVPEFSSEEAEYADTIIRIMDSAAKHGHRVAEAIIAKMAMNKTRGHKHGGKLC